MVTLLTWADVINLINAYTCDNYHWTSPADNYH